MNIVHGKGATADRYKLVACSDSFKAEEVIWVLTVGLLGEKGFCSSFVCA
jgi:hypothetical protein